MDRKAPYSAIMGDSQPMPEVFFTAFFKKHENDLAGCGPIQPYPAAIQIYREDAAAEVVYLIERGFIKLSQIGPDGNEIIVGLRTRYWLLAAPAVILGVPYSFTATTLIPCQLRPITANCFLNLLQTDTEFSWEMHRHLSQSVFTDLNKVAEVSSMSASERMKNFICQLISELSPEKTHTHNHFQVQLKQHELAEIIGISPEHLCRLVKKMEGQGIIINEKGIITVQDVSRFSSLKSPNKKLPEID